MTTDLPVPPLLAMLIAGVFGAVIGSFLNVCILRWGAEPKQSVVRPPSRCPRCGAGVAWHDNIPIVSWLILRGRCRGCQTRISMQYPLVELATALLWAYMACRHGLSLEALRGAIFGTILLGIAMTDAREYIIPDEFSLGGLVIGLDESSITIRRPSLRRAGTTTSPSARRSAGMPSGTITDSARPRISAAS